MVGALLLCLPSALAHAAYPDRPITLIVPWGAGGGTDAVARILASLMEKDLGQPVNVVNRTGGCGVVGHQAIAAAPPDGYTIGIITVEIGMMHHQKLTDLNGTSYTPLALVNADPAGVQVRADAPYKNVTTCWPPSRPTPASSRRPAPARAASGTWRSPGCCSDQKIDPARAAVGAVERRRAGAARPGRRRRRSGAVLAARSARAHRSRQGEEPGDHGRRSPRRCSPRCRR